MQRDQTNLRSNIHSQDYPNIQKRIRAMKTRASKQSKPKSKATQIDKTIQTIPQTNSNNQNNKEP